MARRENGGKRDTEEDGNGGRSEKKSVGRMRMREGEVGSEDWEWVRVDTHPIVLIWRQKLIHIYYNHRLTRLHISNPQSTK